ncbi:hypothetical protein DY000_02048724 [Brassica cretica]|uniref:Uncharacterized protein n=1 Tax=Brassica cretica TaxID=69181 RepID=A0ABQ7EV96_BRACR|nr:hypothetical protein DY000_02048724 [Brassica cretica]
MQPLRTSPLELDLVKFIERQTLKLIEEEDESQKMHDRCHDQKTQLSDVASDVSSPGENGDAVVEDFTGDAEAENLNGDTTAERFTRETAANFSRDTEAERFTGDSAAGSFTRDVSSVV